jgi:hypothetical protein
MSMKRPEFLIIEIDLWYIMVIMGTRRGEGEGGGASMTSFWRWDRHRSPGGCFRHIEGILRCPEFKYV